MTQEENAKAYTELINRLEDVKNAIKKKNYGIAMDILCKPYPEFQITISTELKESRDEMIRQLLISFVKYDMPDNYSDDFSKEDCLAWLEAQGEQKLADKVEPKFKVGDWIIDVQGVSANQIIGYEDDSYHIKTSCSKFHLPMKLAEKNYRLWTIADAKDGDVLCSNQIIVLFKQWEDNTDYCFVIAHAGIDISGKLQITNGHWLISNKSKPATKEQRDLLFKKMHEAGYEWDAENKELIKIEQNPADKKGMNLVEEEMTPFQKEVFCIIDTTIEEEQGLKQVCDKLFALASNEIKQKFSWSEEDEKQARQIERIVHDDGCTQKLQKQIADWFKSIKDRVQPKQEWSEEDGVMLDEIIDFFENGTVKLQHDLSLYASWLKSLKDRYTWKPSGEQMDALHYVTNFDYGGHKATLVSLYEQLKKLREG